MKKKIKIIKLLLAIFIIALFISGATAMPIDAELSFLLQFLQPESSLYVWINKVLVAYRQVKIEHPFLL
ncbi:MAG: hypothetical protein V4676_07035, partial [Bacteroidota bacterium]